MRKAQGKMEHVVGIIMAFWMDLLIVTMVAIGLVLGLVIIHTEIKDRAEHALIRKEILLLIDLNKQIAANTSRVSKGASEDIPRAVNRVERVVQQVPPRVEKAIRTVMEEEGSHIRSDTLMGLIGPEGKAGPPGPQGPPGKDAPRQKTIHDPDSDPPLTNPIKLPKE
jgi:hypothetical protein